MNKFRKSILYAVLAAVAYNIWKARNEVLWLGQLCLVNTVVKKIIGDVKLRVKLVMPRKVSQKERDWVEYICKV